MARILILTAGFGEGHNSAARGLAKALSQLSDLEGVHCTQEIHDIVLESYGSIGQFMRRAYSGTINRAPRLWQAVYDLVDRTDMVTGNLGALGRMADCLRHLITDFRPDVIATTYPVYGYLLDRIFVSTPSSRVPVVTIVTDSISINSVWTKAPSDWFLVPNDETAEVMRKMGVPSERLRVDGFPVNPDFAVFGASGVRPSAPPWHVLYMINSGKKNAPGLVADLLTIPDISLTVAAGKDQSLKEKIEAVVAATGRHAEVLGWSDQMPFLMCRSHLLIGKAGGATVQEILAAGCPIIITKVVPGQEEGNAWLIERNQCGHIAGHEKHVASAVRSALSDNARQLLAWQQNTTRLSRPTAATEIARFLLSLCPQL